METSFVYIYSNTNSTLINMIALDYNLKVSAKFNMLR